MAIQMCEFLSQAAYPDTKTIQFSADNLFVLDDKIKVEHLIEAANYLSQGRSEQVQ